jgi:serine/threonine protein kinase
MANNNDQTLLNGRYRLVAQQGSGGMAVIYRAQDMALGRTVAVKILRPSLTTDPTFITRFRNEARAIANLSHPNIVTVYDVGNDGPTYYMVMEYVEGQDLKKLIRNLGVMSVKRALNLAIQICEGIGFAHRAGLVHADVKPQNILLTNQDDRVKVTDFGIAQALTDTQPQQRAEVVWGSPHYFAPEQAKGEKPSPASDVYSIGIVMFEMLTGRLPFMGASQQDLALAHVRERIPLVSEVNPSVPENLSNIIYKVMSKEPSDRYRTADQLGNVLISYRNNSEQHTAHHPAANISAPPPVAAPLPPVMQPVVPPVQPPSQYAPPAQQDRPPGVPRSAGPAPVQAPLPPPPSQASVPQSAEMTQRFGAPVAPQNSPFRQADPAPLSGQQQQPAQNWQRDESQLYPPAQGQFPQQGPAYEEPARGGSIFDPVTIVLMVMAFFSVICLIPLYIAVIQARFG